MKRSNLSIDELEESSNVAIACELYKESVVLKMDCYRMDAIAPVGSLNSSVKEMANWLKVWFRNGKERILPEAFCN